MHDSRRTTGVLILVLCGLLLAGCAPASKDTAGSGGPFPVTITHGQGTATITAKPKRVVALGWGDAQIADALGAKIVGVTKNPYRADGSWPGMRGRLGADVAKLDPVHPQPERIAALNPDLVLMTTAQPGFAEAYGKLSGFAPVLSYRKAALRDSGDELTRMIGRALGEQRRASELIRDSHRRIADFAGRLPGLDGTEVLFGQFYQGNTGLIVTPDSPSVRFLNSLGLRVPESIAAHAGDDAALGTVQLSTEELDLLDSADVAFIYSAPGDAAFTGQPLVSRLRLRQHGNLHLIDNDLASLLLTPNPAVTRQILDELREPLAGAVEAAKVEGGARN